MLSEESILPYMSGTRVSVASVRAVTSDLIGWFEQESLQPTSVHVAFC